MTRFALVLVAAWLPTLALAQTATDEALAHRSVLQRTAEILEMRVEDVVPDKSFAEQASPGDALDVIEVVMAVEEDLGIEIPDEMLDAAVPPEARDASAYPSALTILELQRIAAGQYAKSRPAGR